MNISIKLEKKEKAYFPGETIAGIVSLIVVKPKAIRKITLNILGSSTGYWTECLSNTNYRLDCKYINATLILMGTGEKFQIEPGLYVYNFEYPLSPDAPFTFDCNLECKTTYQIKANVDIPWAFDEMAIENITVLPRIILGNLFVANRRLLFSKTKTIGMLCFSSGQISVLVSAPKSGYVLGESIMFFVEIENEADCDVHEVHLQLHEIIKVIVPFRDTKKTLRRTPLRRVSYRNTIPQKTTKNFTIEMKIPPGFPSTLGSISVIKIFHQVEISCVIAGGNLNLTEKASIFIGTEP